MTVPKGEAAKVFAAMDERTHNSGIEAILLDPLVVSVAGQKEIIFRTRTTAQGIHLGPALFVLRVDLLCLALDVLCVQRTWSIAQA